MEVIYKLANIKNNDIVEVTYNTGFFTKTIQGYVSSIEKDSLVIISEGRCYHLLYKVIELINGNPLEQVSTYIKLHDQNVKVGSFVKLETVDGGIYNGEINLNDDEVIIDLFRYFYKVKETDRIVS